MAPCPDGPCLVQVSTVQFVVVLWGEPSSKAKSSLPCPVVTFDEVLQRGRAGAHSFRPPPITRDTLATLVFTSGTTGNPKVRGSNAACLLPAAGCTWGNARAWAGSQPGSPCGMAGL